MTALLWLISPHGRRFTIGIALLVLIPVAWKMYDRHVISKYEQKRETAAVPAHLDAADQRAIDAATQAAQGEAYEQAIRHANDSGGPSAAAVSLNCERLRRARVSDLPAICGR